jgi:hypothetical protein
VEGVSGVCVERVHVPDMGQKSRNKFLKRWFLPQIEATRCGYNLCLKSGAKLQNFLRYKHRHIKDPHRGYI